MLIYKEKCVDSALLQCAAHLGDNFVIKYLDEIEKEFENTSACLSGSQMGSNHEKIEVKNLAAPFK